MTMSIEDRLAALIAEVNALKATANSDVVDTVGESVLAAQIPIILPPEPPKLKLDLGSGPRPIEGFKGVDIAEGVTDFCFDLLSGEKWPWEDNSVDEMHSSHFIEHIESGNRWETYRGMGNLKLFFFEEAYRIIKPGGFFKLSWPALQNVRAFQDPTHCDYIPAERMSYLLREARKQMGVEHYGFGKKAEDRLRMNWVTHSVTPSISAAASLKPAEVQQVRYQETWNYSQDFFATLQAIKE